MANLLISKKLIEQLLEASKRYFPKEFFAFIASSYEEQTIIDEFVYVPFRSNNYEAFINDFLIPLDLSIVGTFHSHPSLSKEPSKKDLETFRKLGSYHIIACYPFSFKDFAVYNNNGQKILFRLVNI